MHKQPETYRKGYLWKRLRMLQVKHSAPWTVRGVAERAGLSVSYLYRLLRGDAVASPEIAKRIAKILDIPLDAIPMHRTRGRPTRY
jgi:transcriptional regulator with XRE-family HTH domain